MSLNSKVNLQVKRQTGLSNETRFQFRFYSYESSAVSLSDYRIVGFFNIPTIDANVIIEQQGGTQGSGVGGTTGTLPARS